MLDILNLCRCCGFIEGFTMDFNHGNMFLFLAKIGKGSDQNYKWKEMTNEHDWS